jgi:hypothetical protein
MTHQSDAVIYGIARIDDPAKLGNIVRFTNTSRSNIALSFGMSE